MSCCTTTPFPCGPQTPAALQVLKRAPSSPIQRDLPCDSNAFGPLTKAMKCCCGCAVFPAAANAVSAEGIHCLACQYYSSLNAYGDLSTFCPLSPRTVSKCVNLSKHHRPVTGRSRRPTNTEPLKRKLRPKKLGI